MTVATVHAVMEETVLEAFARMRRVGLTDPQPAVVIYGWADSPHPDGWTVDAARRAARRLERRGRLQAVPGDRFNPRRWRPA